MKDTRIPLLHKVSKEQAEVLLQFARIEDEDLLLLERDENLWEDE